MDHARFDALARALFGSRRTLLAGALALPANQLGASETDARKRRRRKKPKQRQTADAPNAFGCISVGERCQDASQCCSGVCDGSSGEKTCRAHHTGTCPQGGEGYCEDLDPARDACNGTEHCLCARTTAGSDACVADAPSGFDYCTGCVSDRDCEAIGYPAGSVCLPLHAGFCAGLCPNDRACFPPCGTEWPVL